MYRFEEFADLFNKRFSVRQFPESPATLYDPAEYFLSLGGKRIRPVICLMANELFGDVHPDSWHLASAIELFHNFTLIHDDIMDKAPLRRGLQTLHTRFGEPTALLAGDVTLVAAYEELNKINPAYLPQILTIFNATAKEVCEGQQLDMDFEQRDAVGFEEYIEMIALKTSVLLAASLKMGAVMGGAGKGNQQHLYNFGKKLGIAYQIQDDYLDAFGDASKVGKRTGGDIVANKKTFLLIRALESGSADQVAALQSLMKENPADKIERVLEIFRQSDVDSWAINLKEQYTREALYHLEEVAVVSSRKKSLQSLVDFLIRREY